MPLALYGKVSANYRSHVKATQVRSFDLDGNNEVLVTLIVEKIDPISGNTLTIDPWGNDHPWLISEGIIPHIGMTLEQWYTLTFAEYQWEGLARLRDYTFEPASGGSLIVNLRFTTYYVPQVDPDPQGQNLTLLLPASIEMTTTNRSMSMWRSGTTLTPPSPTLDSVAIIAGNTLSSTTGMLGAAVDVPQMRIRIRIMQDTATDNSTFVDQMDNLKTYIGKRNDATFLGFDRGEIYCEGMSMQRIEHNFYEVVFDFIYDFYYEHSQFPVIEGDGQPKMEEDPLQAGVYRVRELYWRRVTREYIDFTNILPYAELQTYVETGWWDLP